MGNPVTSFAFYLLRELEKSALLAFSRRMGSLVFVTGIFLITDFYYLEPTITHFCLGNKRQGLTL